MSRSAILGIIGAIVIVSVILICTSIGQQTYVQAAPPVVANYSAPPVVVQSHNDGFVSGMIVGHMLSGPTMIHHYPTYVAPRTTIVRNTTIINRSVRVTPTTRSYSYSPSRSFGSFRGR